MKYEIRNADGEIFGFKNAEEILIALQRSLGTEYEYRISGGDWFQE